MKFLELKIPPVILFLMFGAGILAVSKFFPSLNISYNLRDWVSWLFSIAGGMMVVAGMIEFQRAKTTVDPMKPDAASKIVSSGIYRFSRNPMYLGMLFILTAFAFKYSNLLSPLFLIGFVLYMNRFQIMPEESALTDKFGDDYVEYKQSVRRWI